MLVKLETLTDNTVQLKMATIVAGLIDIIIASAGSCGTSYDLYFLVTIVVCFCLSLLHLSCTMLDMFKVNCTSRGMDFIYHVIAGFLILISCIVLFASTAPNSCGVMEKCSAATLGLVNAVIYLYISWSVMQKLRGKDTQALMPLYFFCVCARSPPEFPTKTHKTQAVTPTVILTNNKPTTETIIIKPQPEMIDEIQTVPVSVA